jgi:hypothetical protein
MLNRTLTTLALLSTCVSLGPASADDWAPVIQRQLDALQEEPSVQSAQAAALAFFNIDPGTVQGMRTRAAWKALMPTLAARYRRNDTRLDVDTINLAVRDLDGDNAADDEDRFLFDHVEGISNEYQVGIRWNLPLLIFNAEVLDVGSLAVLQEGVLKEITRLYYTRRRLQIDLILNPPDDPSTRMSKSLRIEELTSTLDAMTGNLFIRHFKRPSQSNRRASRAIP